MIISNNIFNSPRRQIAAKVELYKGSTLAHTFYNTDAIKNIKVSREGDTNKFFGFGVCQKVELTLIDTQRTLNISKDDELGVYFSAGGDFISSLPTFIITEAKRDENTNDITVVGYDRLNAAAAHTVAELGIGDGSATIGRYAVKCAGLLGMSATYDATNTGFSVEGVANFLGSENLRTVLNAIAEATQTIYFVNSYNSLVFKQLNVADYPSLIVTHADYFTLTSGDTKTLSKIVSSTELGDNINVGNDTGTTQYIKDNPFWDLREDLATLLEEAYARAGGTSITIYNCSWRGNPHLEYGDMIAIQAKDGSLISSYLLNESIEYTGGFSSTIKWEFKEDEAREAGTPISVGEMLNETYAKVDKINKQIDLVAKESTEATEKVSAMEITLDEISGTVSQTEALANGNREAIANLKVTTDALSASVSSFKSVTDELGNELSSVREDVSTKITAQDATLIFKKEIANGVDKVTTSTGFTFNEEGLTVSKSGTEMSTTITEDGMTVYKDGNEMLTASHEGVKAVDLHATTYLIVGKNSRFEDYEKDGEARTGCFWIGG